MLKKKKSSSIVWKLKKQPYICLCVCVYSVCMWLSGHAENIMYTMLFVDLSVMADLHEKEER